MLFNSLDFAIFLPIVFALYWLLEKRSLVVQNFYILVVSYIFYGWWDWRFLFLIFLSSIVDYLVGLGLQREENRSKRKLFLWISLSVNLGMLGFFKYFNFFIDSFSKAFSLFGQPIETSTLDIILPVGISFYTFQTLSYSIDVYKRKFEPTRDLISFLAFVSFFPQLVAGPIERATKLLPQFYTRRTFNYDHARDGLRQMLWGLFKKVVIADNLAVHVNYIFSNSADLTGSTLALGAFFFVIQIYTDFSGYSDVAIGVAKLFGFQLSKNFDFPLFARNHVEFWQKWHISLTTWFRDYLFIPLSLNVENKFRRAANYFLVFGINGLWHGANWTFFWWGMLNAIYLIPGQFGKQKSRYKGIPGNNSIFPSFREFYAIIVTLGLSTLAIIFFRAETVSHAFQYISNIFINPGSFFLPSIYLQYSSPILLIIFFIMIDWFGRREEYSFGVLLKFMNSPLRFSTYYLMIVAIFLSSHNNTNQYIYFQF